MESDMRLADWRKQHGQTTMDVARGIGIEGDRGGASVWNWETGRSRADADIIMRIEQYTKSAVRPSDMHETRLDWLRANRPEKFNVIPDEAA
jgi:transcriptional regulator with XRE-family HTH domain